MKSNLVKRGFLSLIFTQFFGAANDNLLKGVLTFMVIDGVWSGRLGAGGQGLVALCFTIPFVVLSGYAGQFADRNSKRYVSVLVKVVEIPIAAMAMLGFWFGSLWITLAALVALTCQSAFFGPAKYGMIPELVDDRDLSRANGTINMMTNIAVILGTLLAGEVADRYDPLPASDCSTAPAILWLPGALMLAVAAAGLIAVLFLVRLEPGDKNLKYNLNPLATYISTIREMSKSPLLMVMLAWGYFYLLAGLALLIIPEYTIVLKSYNVDRAEASVLLGILGVAIGLGSVTAGLISGHRIEPRLIPIGALGITVFFVLLGTVEPSLPALAPKLRVAFSSVGGFIFGAGVFAGFYIIPLQAMLQKLSPDDERGRFLGTANAISFSFLAVASLLYWIIKPLFIDAPQRIFLVSAALMLVGAAFFLVKLRHTVLSPTHPA
ncbi:MAG: MFS transporter [Phycisphaerales bacterium]